MSLSDLQAYEIGFRRALLDLAMQDEWDEWNSLRLEFADLLQELGSPEERAARLCWKVENSGEFYADLRPIGIKITYKPSWWRSVNTKNILGFPPGMLSPCAGLIMWKKQKPWSVTFDTPDTDIHPLGLLSLFPELEYSS